MRFLILLALFPTFAPTLASAESSYPWGGRYRNIESVSNCRGERLVRWEDGDCQGWRVYFMRNGEIVPNKKGKPILLEEYCHVNGDESAFSLLDMETVMFIGWEKVKEEPNRLVKSMREETIGRGGILMDEKDLGTTSWELTENGNILTTRSDTPDKKGVECVMERVRE